MMKILIDINKIISNEFVFESLLTHEYIYCIQNHQGIDQNICRAQGNVFLNGHIRNHLHDHTLPRIHKESGHFGNGNDCYVLLP